MQKQRLGFVGIIVEDRIKSADPVNHILSDYGNHIVARVGIPYKGKNCSVITLVIDMTTDELGSLTGKLGSLKGVLIKSALMQK
ncbi:MAG: iron-only hydrogenase system regulator [Candidatus Aureabacteria bacterium]|nr:iron-only hydrogenase system regulator [Candidatus Auribacterota bacterium]